ncbi:pyridoxal phosphatase [Lonsdalea quercina]|uniref:pyridoxal phosphatase n=1 Tax=Lonsdalea quercina TaxID=71657 RepID=UPI0039769CC1
MSYRAIALDLDGTLLTAKKTILPASMEALALARQAGIKVLIVSGRHHSAIRPFYQALELDTPAICCNGSYLYHYQTKSASEGHPLTPEQAKGVLKKLQQFDIHGLMYADDQMLYEKPTGHVVRALAWSDTLPADLRPNFRHVDNLEEETARTQQIWKFATHHPDNAHLNGFAQQVEEELGVTCEWSWKDQVDVAQSGNSKGKLLRRWVEDQGLQMQDIVAFGDNFNDISMLSTVGLGVAMGNSADAVKESADVVIGHNEEPGIAELIRKRIL